MAVRTTLEAVGKVVELDDEIDVTPFIEDANLLVDDLCLESGYSETRLTRIETWLAAHLYVMRDPRVTTESAGPVSASYQYQTGLFLASSMQGQQAMLLDTAGNLANLSKDIENGKKSPAKAKIIWMGSCDE